MSKQSVWSFFWSGGSNVTRLYGNVLSCLLDLNMLCVITSSGHMTLYMWFLLLVTWLYTCDYFFWSHDFIHVITSSGHMTMHVIPSSGHMTIHVITSSGHMTLYMWLLLLVTWLYMWFLLLVTWLYTCDYFFWSHDFIHVIYSSSH